MSTLLQLLTRLGSVFIFLFLEGICIYLVVRYNEGQERIFINSTNIIAGKLTEQSDRFHRFFNLSTENTRLLAENARLRAQIASAQYPDQLERDSAIVLSPDSLVLQQYTFTGAEVVGNSVALRNNMLTLNRGSRHGIRPNMGVITENGVVGIVRQVGRHFSSVMSVLHAQSRISARIRGERYFGSLTWQGPDPRIMSLEDVPKYAQIAVGDTVETSGYSELFPAEILIGTITAYSLPPGESNYKISVKLTTDLARVQYVYVVNNLFQPELDSLRQAK
ncbi:MAG: rod shape-determining protein MreC [Lewinellaceae bacterium]|nr:rod shape-determining protein MreC [Lewinellaceae bacterium]